MPVFHVKKRVSSGKRVPQCQNHHSVVHPVAFTRVAAWQLCGIKWGAANMRVPASGMRFPEEPN